MNTCKNCKWWEEREEVYSSMTHMVCDYSNNMNNAGPSSFEVYADALDDSGLECELVTGPDFGCVHFEEK